MARQGEENLTYLMANHKLLKLIDAACPLGQKTFRRIIVEEAEHSIAKACVGFHRIIKTARRRPGANDYHTGEIEAHAPVLLKREAARELEQHQRHQHHGVVKDICPPRHDRYTQKGNEREEEQGMGADGEQGRAHHILHADGTALVMVTRAPCEHGQIAYIDQQP